MSGRLYTCSFAVTAVTAQVDFFEFNTPAGCSMDLHALFLNQTTELGDAQEEMIPWAVKRGATTTGTGGTQAAVPVAVAPGDVASTLAYDTLNTTKATGGTIVVIHNDSFNIRAGLGMIWTPEMRPRLGPSSRMTVELQATPADSISFVGTAYVEELS